MRNMIPNIDTGPSTPQQLLTGFKPDLSLFPTVAWATLVLSWVPFPADKLSPRAEHGIVVGYHLSSKRAIRLYTLNASSHPIVVVGSKYKVIQNLSASWLTRARLKKHLALSIHSPISTTIIQLDDALDESTSTTVHPQEGKGNEITDSTDEVMPRVENENDDIFFDGDIDPFTDQFLDDLYNDLNSIIDFIGDPDIFDKTNTVNDILYNTLSNNTINYLQTYNYVAYSASNTQIDDQTNPHSKAIMKELQSLIGMDVFEVINIRGLSGKCNALIHSC